MKKLLKRTLPLLFMMVLMCSTFSVTANAYNHGDYRRVTPTEFTSGKTISPKRVYYNGAQIGTITPVKSGNKMKCKVYSAIYRHYATISNGEKCISSADAKAKVNAQTSYVNFVNKNINNIGLFYNVA